MSVNTAVGAAEACEATVASGAATRRLIGALAAVGAAVVLAVAAWLEPSPTGLGTHRQLAGLPDCGWIAMFDMPCPTCGMTTAFAHAANGNLPASLHAQPLGFALALGTAAGLLLGVHAAVTGSRLVGMMGRMMSMRLAWWIVAAVLASWAYKVLTYKGAI
jgi:hypothetical protein